MERYKLSCEIFAFVMIDDHHQKRTKQKKKENKIKTATTYFPPKRQPRPAAHAAVTLSYNPISLRATRLQVK